MSRISGAGGPNGPTYAQLKPVRRLNNTEYKVRAAFLNAMEKVNPTTHWAAHVEVEQVYKQANLCIIAISDEIDKANKELELISGSGTAGDEIAKSVQERISYWSQVKERLSFDVKDLYAEKEGGNRPEAIARLKDKCLETMREGYENAPKRVQGR